MRSTVVLIPLDTYDQPRVDAAVREGVTLLGGLSGLIDPKERVLLKPNLLGRAIPEKAVTTHPAVFSAVCRLLREEGYAHLSYGDSPGNPTTTPAKAAEASGIEEAARRYALEKAGIDPDAPKEVDPERCPSGIPERPYCKGRNYDPNRYSRK